MNRTDSFEIQFAPLNFERRDISAPYDRLLGITAHLRIIVLGREWFSEPDFPVVELAAAVTTWLRRGGEFKFDTLEAEESPFLSIHPIGSQCGIEAAWQAFQVDEPLEFESVRAIFGQFVRTLEASTREQIHIDVDDLLNP